MNRRSFLVGAGAGVAALAAPRLARAAGERVLKFIPQSDLTVLDPIWTTAYVTRNHGYMVFDTLFGTDGALTPSPQMAAGMTTENDGKLVTITLRDGLKWHDGERVLARDCVASINRWGKRDAYGQTLLAYSDELSAQDDKTIRFRLKRPFPLLETALGKSPTSFPAMMPERLASTDAFKQVTEMVGSGPFTFKAAERVPGNLVVYERFADYTPREGGKPVWTAGPKIVNFDRVEWHIVQDPATAAAALQRSEVDWWENPTNDLLPLLRGDGHIKVLVQDPTGLMGAMRLNHLTQPFNNPRVRRALLKAISQEDFAIAVAGDDPAMRHVPTGIYCPGTPMATDAGLEVFTSKRDYEAVKREIAAAGYKGEKVVLLAPTDFPILKAQADVCADVMQKAGLNVDYQAMDWGTVVQRRAKKEPTDQGGWSVFNTFWAGLDQFNPVGHTFLRGTGEAGGVPGWPSSPRIEELRQRWLDAADLAQQKKIAEEIQLQALEDVPYVPTGQVLTATAYRDSITDVLEGFVMFWNVRRVT
ncbi:MAG: ABC transporter substrate-binding protein [Acetobacteraceae bacterium]|nr:ABC transporter substrate-binding protein [Acetobacteraceae bacterium]